ncbi:MAG TPA: glycosyltransferase family 39 protein [Ktedonobacterales bacterium]|nr:glycosyltransferase family 39 protein [Ktedonobacterales bacterium]
MRLQAARTTGRRTGAAGYGGWVWARHWEFWLALALGAALRLWRLDLTQYLDDQTRLMVLARASVTHGLIPLTGIPSSIHTLNPPLSVYLLLPFAAFTADPMPVVISVALWNIAGIALCYIFTVRYFGRRVAALGALLFASCGAAINYSRFIWQQNYLPPLLVLWALTLYLGAVEGRRRWFGANVTLLALATLLHPTAALLAPVTLVAAVLAPRFPRWRAWAASALIILALALPTLLWEAVSGFSDLSAIRRYALGHSHITPAVFYYLYLAIGSPNSNLSGAAVPFDALNILASMLFVAGWLVLSARIIRPARALPWRRKYGVMAALRAWLVELYYELRDSDTWKINLLLWLSVSLPIALMIRHSAALFAHYLMVLYPTAFIVSAIGAVSAITWITRRLRVRDPRLAERAALALEVSLLLLILARSAQWVSYPASLTGARFSAYETYDYGYPLADIQAGARQLDQLQRQTGAATVEVVTPSDPRYRLPADYIFAGERADRVTLASNCLLLPSTGSWLIASAAPNLPAASLLVSITAAKPVGALRMTGGPDYPVYQVSNHGSALAGQQSVSPVRFDDGAGDALQLTAVAPLGRGSLVLSWSIVAAHAAEGQARSFTVSAAEGGASGSATCEAQRWQAGETLYTILPVASGEGLRLRLKTGTSGLDIRAAAPVRFLSALDGGQAPVAMAPEPAQTGKAPIQPTINGDGSITIHVPGAP